MYVRNIRQLGSELRHGAEVYGSLAWEAVSFGCFRVPDACTRLHAPRRGGAAAGLSSPPGRCRTR